MFAAISAGRSITIQAHDQSMEMSTPLLSSPIASTSTVSQFSLPSVELTGASNVKGNARKRLGKF